MNEKAKAFIELAKADPELAGRLTEMTAEELVEAAKARGVELAAEDLAPTEEPLDVADLDNVAGGSCTCGYVGNGMGQSGIAEGKTYYCGCIGGGMGDADPSTLSRDCQCSLSGQGYDAGE